MSTRTKEQNDNRSQQLDRENIAYWRSRGHPDRPADWKERAQE